MYTVHVFVIHILRNDGFGSNLKMDVQSTPLNRVTLVPEHFDPIKRSELILFLWFCSWPSDPINR